MKSGKKTKAHLTEGRKAVRSRLPKRRSAPKQPARKDSQDNYRLILEHANEAIVVAQDGKVQFANRRAEEIYEYSKDEVISKPFADFVHPNDRDTVLSRHRRRIKGEEPPKTYEFRILDRNKKPRWTQITVMRIPWHGKPATLALLSDITACRQAEEALRVSEREKSLILDTVSEPVTYQNRDMRVIWANRAAGESVGLRQEQIAGRRCYEVWHRRRRPCVGCPVVKALQSGQPEEAEITSPDGRIWFIRGYPVRDKSGQIIGAVDVALDITARKHSEDALRQSKERYHAVVEAQTELVVRSLPGGIVTFVNEACCRYFGKKRGEMIGRSFLPYIPEEDRERVKEHFASLNKDNPLKTIEHRVIAPSGEIRWQQWTNRTIFNKQGQLVEFQAVGRDITERKEAEHALAESERRYRTTVDALTEAVHLVDGDLRIVLFNEAFRQWCQELGLDTDVIGRHVFEAFPFLPERVRQEYAQVFATGLPLSTEETSTVAGRHIVTQTRKIPILEKGKVAWVVTVITDSTQRKQTEVALRAASRMEATTTLAAGVAHDLNNLMVAVLGNAALVRANLGDDHSEALMLLEIEKAAESAGNLAQQLLAFARGGKYQPRVINVNDIIAEVVTLEKRAIPHRVHIKLDIAPDLWNTLADPSQMSQVLMNLCINGVEAIAGSGRITIITRNIDVDERFVEIHPGLQPGRHVYLSVQDTGCGMDTETRARVFEPFFSTKFQGRGLGLAAVYGIVKNHGGHISVYSEVGKGTTFKIYLPATEADLTRSPVPETTIPTGTETVLIIDDEEPVLRVAERLLDQLGYRVLIAHNGHEAVEIARSFDGDIHLALLDIGMPVLGGPEAYPLLRQARPGMKVVLCSGYGLDATAQALLDAGASSFVQKPFQLVTLGREIRKALDRR